MKKLLSICISVIMVMGLMPTALVSATNDITAEVPSEGYWLFEAEDYPNLYQADTADGAYTQVTNVSTAEDGTASGGEYINANLYGKAKGYYELPINVEVAGDYIVEARVKANQIYTVSNARLAINGVETEPVPSGGEQELVVVRVPAIFNQGDNTIRFMVNKSNHNLNCFAYIDYIKIEPMFGIVPENLSAEGVLFEAENYPKLYQADTADGAYTQVANVSIAEDGAANGGEYINANLYGKAKGYYELPIKVGTAGSYIVEARVKANQIYTVSNARLAINGVETLLVPSGGEQELVVVRVPATFNQGDNTIRFMVNKSNHNLNCFAYVDYIKVFPVKAATDISDEIPTKIEAEGYAISIDNENISDIPLAVREDAGGDFSGNKYVTVQVQDGNLNADSVEMKIPVKITTAGGYDVTTKTMDHYDGATSLATYSLLVDGEEELTYPKEATAVWSENTTNVYLSAGEHIITIKSTGTATNIGFSADYIEFAPTSETFGSSVDFIEADEGFAGTILQIDYELGSATKAVLNIVYKSGDSWVTHETALLTGAEDIYNLTLPVALKGKEISVEFIPVKTEDEKDLYGKLESWQPEGGILREAVTYTVERLEKVEGVYEAEVKIQVNKTLSVPENVYVILAQYKTVDDSEVMIPYADGAMTDAMKAASVQAIGESTIEVELTADLGATEARLFIWDGTSLSNAGASIYEDVRSTLDE